MLQDKIQGIPASDLYYYTLLETFATPIPPLLTCALHYKILHTYFVKSTNYSTTQKCLLKPTHMYIHVQQFSSPFLLVQPTPLLTEVVQRNTHIYTWSKALQYHCNLPCSTLEFMPVTARPCDLPEFMQGIIVCLSVCQLL